MKLTTYTQPCLADRVATIETMEELVAAKEAILSLWTSGKLSRRTARRLERVANERYRVLSTRLVEVAPVKILGPDGQPARG